MSSKAVFLSQPNIRNGQGLRQPGKHCAEGFCKSFPGIGLAEAVPAGLGIRARSTCGERGSKHLCAAGLFEGKRQGQIDPVTTTRGVGAVKVKTLDRHLGDEIVMPCREARARRYALDGKKIRTQGFNKRVWQSFECPCKGRATPVPEPHPVWHELLADHDTHAPRIDGLIHSGSGRKLECAGAEASCRTKRAQKEQKSHFGPATPPATTRLDANGHNDLLTPECAKSAEIGSEHSAWSPRCRARSWPTQSD